MTATLIPNFDDQTTEWGLIAQQAAEKKRRARQMIEQAMTDKGGSGMAGQVYMVGNQYGNLAQSLGGAILGRMADNDLSQASQQRQQAQDEWQQQFNAADTPEAKQQLLTTARNKGLRYDLEQQFAKQEADRIERGEQLAADRVEKEANAQAQREFLAAQGDLNRQNRVDLRQMPATVVHVGNGRGGVKAPAGYRYNEDGTALEPIPGGPADKAAKPVNLTAAQQKAVDDSDALLGHIDNALEMVKSNPNAVGFKTILPDMALSKIDPQGVATRAAVGGLSAERVHQLSGAAVSPAEFARLRPYLPASGDTADAVEKKLTSLKGEVERIRATHMKGPTRAQPQQPTNERKTIGGVTYEKRGGQWFAL